MYSCVVRLFFQFPNLQLTHGHYYLLAFLSKKNFLVYKGYYSKSRKLYQLTLLSIDPRMRVLARERLRNLTNPQYYSHQYYCKRTCLFRGPICSEEIKRGKF